MNNEQKQKLRAAMRSNIIKNEAKMFGELAQESFARQGRGLILVSLRSSGVNSEMHAVSYIPAAENPRCAEQEVNTYDPATQFVIAFTYPDDDSAYCYVMTKQAGLHLKAEVEKLGEKRKWVQRSFIVNNTERLGKLAHESFARRGRGALTLALKGRGVLALSQYNLSEVVYTPAAEPHPKWDVETEQDVNSYDPDTQFVVMFYYEDSPMCYHVINFGPTTTLQGEAADN